jgi:hypothetical protein
MNEPNDLNDPHEQRKVLAFAWALTAFLAAGVLALVWRCG